MKTLRLKTKRGRPWVCRWRAGPRLHQQVIPVRFRKNARLREIFRANVENQVNGLDARSAESPMLGHALVAFLDSRRLRGRSAETLRIYEAVLRRFVRLAGDRPAGVVRPTDVEGYLARAPAGKRPGELAPATRRKERNHIRVFFRWLNRQGYIDRNPVDGVDVPPAPRGRPEAYTEAEARRILVEARKRRPWADAAVRLALLCGLRAGELEAVAAADVDFPSRTLRVPARKSARPRTVRFDDETGGLLHDLAYRGDHLLWGPPDGPFLTPATFRRKLVIEARDILAAAGVRKSPEPAKPLHAMRRTFGTIVARSVSPEVLGAVMGHVSTQTTRDYYVDPEALEAARVAQAAMDGLAHRPGVGVDGMGDLAGDLGGQGGTGGGGLEDR